jgi:hypothetical protein
MGEDGRYTHDRSDPLKALRNIRVGQVLYLTEDFSEGQVRPTLEGGRGGEGGRERERALGGHLVLHVMAAVSSRCQCPSYP